MEKISLEKIIEEKYTYTFVNKFKLIKKITIFIVGRITHLKEINDFILNHKESKGIAFIDDLFETLNFTYSITQKDIYKIPSEGRLIIVANHPLGALDGLALIKAIGNVREDVKIIGNDILANIKNLNEFIIPMDVDGKLFQRNSLIKVNEALENDEAVIIFPAAEVSRLRVFQIRDSRWRKGAIQLAKKYNAPVLPVYIDGRNSLMFYLSSAVNKYLSRFMLPREIFKKRNKSIEFRIGDYIPAKAFKNSFLDTETQMRLLKKHLYRIGKGKKGVFHSEKTIIHPVGKKLLKNEINQSEYLGETKDGYKIIITDFNSSPSLMKEIARLREVTFRSVGEGTGKKMDLDVFDTYYKHLIVWDDKELEVVGSYRIGIGNEIFETYGYKGFYTAELFNYSDEFVGKYMNSSIELGRSFVQKKYWNTNALNYLWQGIGAFLAKNENIKYLFGAVSISNSYPEEAKKRIVYFYNKWFGSVNNLAVSKNRFTISANDALGLSLEFTGTDYKEDFKILENILKPMGFVVPVLFKHYSDLCYEDGVKFLDFGVDEEFENCIDGLIVLEVDKIREDKKERYIDRFKEKV